MEKKNILLLSFILFCFRFKCIYTQDLSNNNTISESKNVTKCVLAVPQTLSDCQVFGKMCCLLTISDVNGLSCFPTNYTVLGKTLTFSQNGYQYILNCSSLFIFSRGFILTLLILLISN
jgi:hypothetical protein